MSKVLSKTFWRKEKVNTDYHCQIISYKVIKVNYCVVSLHKQHTTYTPLGFTLLYHTRLETTTE